jgi:F-type H+-transporting ATPase subunit epsilon
MLSKGFNCQVITPEGEIYADQVDAVIIPAVDGELGVLRNHTPVLAMLGAGGLRINKGPVTQVWFVRGGFMQFVDNELTVLTQEATRAADIDQATAIEALRQAQSLTVTDDISAHHREEAEDAARARLRVLRRRH